MIFSHEGAPLYGLYNEPFWNFGRKVRPFYEGCVGTNGFQFANLILKLWILVQTRSKSNQLGLLPDISEFFSENMILKTDTPRVLLIWKFPPGPNSENCLYLIFDAPACEKIIIAPDTSHITSAIRKLMLDMPSPGSFQNIGF